MAASRKPKSAPKKTRAKAAVCDVKPRKAKAASVRGGTSLFAALAVHDLQAKLADDALRTKAGEADRLRIVSKPSAKLF